MDGLAASPSQREERDVGADAAAGVGVTVRVLHVVAPARAGGLESVVIQLTTGLRANGHVAQVAAVLDPADASAHPFVEALEDAQVPVHRIVVGTREYRAERGAIARLMRANDVEVLHTHGYRPDVVDGGIARSMNRAHVTTLHGFVGGSWRRRAYEWLQVRAAVRANAAIAVSAPIAIQLRRAGGGGTAHLLRNAVAPNASALDRVASRAALSLPADAVLVGWVGRLSFEKGPDLFVEALALTDDRVHGVFVGDGPLREQMRALAGARNIAHRLHFTGMRPQASRYLAAFDILALTSRSEGTPMVLLEAMWAGVPIVATAVGGVPDIIDQHVGLLCRPGDPAGLQQSFKRLMADQPTALALATAAQMRVKEDYSIARWIRAHEAVYAAVLPGR
jgi:glycosyltransferase involved in cell wall biosynthesis